MVKDVLQQNDQTLAQKFNIRAERFRDFKEVLQPILTNVTFSTNCYDYAANCKRVMPGALGYPGAQIHDAKTPLSTFKLVENTENDGFVRLNPSAGLPPKHYLCLLFQSAEDFHYVRQDNCGFSHKVGHNCCTNQDANRQVISNPLNAAYTNGVKFISAFAVPSGGIETRGFEI